MRQLFLPNKYANNIDDFVFEEKRKKKCIHIKLHDAQGSILLFISCTSLFQNVNDSFFFYKWISI